MSCGLDKLGTANWILESESWQLKHFINNHFINDHSTDVTKPHNDKHYAAFITTIHGIVKKYLIPGHFLTVSGIQPYHP